MQHRVMSNKLENFRTIKLKYQHCCFRHLTLQGCPQTILTGHSLIHRTDDDGFRGELVILYL